VRPAAAKRAKWERSRKDGFSMSLPTPNAAPIRLSPELEKLGSGWSHTVRGSVIKAEASPTQTPTSTAARERTDVKTACRGNQNKYAIPGTIVVQSKQPRTPDANPAASTLPRQSPLEGIDDLLDNFPTEACVEMTCRVLLSSQSQQESPAQR
jgi:hypothetical protein